MRRLAPVQAVVTSTAELTTATVPRDSELPNSTLVEAALRNGWQRNQVQEAIDHIVRQLGESCLEIGLLLDVLTNLHVDNIEANLPSGDSTGSSDSGINDNIMVPSNLASIRAPFAENLNLLDVGHGVDVSDCPAEQVPPPAQTAPIQPPLTRNVEFSEIFRSLEREHTLLTERTTAVCARLDRLAVSICHVGMSLPANNVQILLPIVFSALHK
uniref:Uncharacterized protein n=1 Tax=Arion vulgaris TaxID=1028688 RepID=A0A0B7BH19_9EUPU